MENSKLLLMRNLSSGFQVSFQGALDSAQLEHFVSGHFHLGRFFFQARSQFGDFFPPCSHRGIRHLFAGAELIENSPRPFEQGQFGIVFCPVFLLCLFELMLIQSLFDRKILFIV